MWVIEIHEYDYFTGNKTKQYAYHCKEDAENRLVREELKDFDYGDHYRTTKMFEVKGS